MKLMLIHNAPLSTAKFQARYTGKESPRRRRTLLPRLAVMHRRDTELCGEFLVTIKVDVVDAHFAGLNTIHYLLKVRVFDLQSITDQ